MAKPAGRFPGEGGEDLDETTSTADSRVEDPSSSREGVGEIVRRSGQVAWAIVGMAIATAIVLWLGSRISVVFPPLVLAAMIVFILNPAVTALERRRIPRVLGAALAYLAFFGIVTVLLLLAIPAIQNQAEDFADQWPEVRDNIERWIDDRAESLQGTPFEFDREDLFDRFTNENGFDLGEWLQRATEVGFRVLEVLLIFIIAPVIAFYLLIDLPRLRRAAEGLVPAPARDDVTLVARRLNLALGGFFRGQLAVALIVGILASLGFWLIGLPFWLIAGLVAGIFSLIPLIGPWLGVIPAVLIALTTRDVFTALGAALVMVVVQQIEHRAVSPFVLRRALKLHPVLVMVALLLGGTLFGFFGLLVAVPVTATLTIVGGHVWRVRVLGQIPAEWHDEPAENEGGTTGAAPEVAGVAARDVRDDTADATPSRRARWWNRKRNRRPSDGEARPGG